MKGKLVVLEGTDCSGKETQTKLLIKRLQSTFKVQNFSFPNYNSPTGLILGGPYLGKPQYGKCIFKQGATKVDPKVVSLYYAADRKYNIKIIQDYLNKGYIVFLDRYVYSNMAHQGSKIDNEKERKKMYQWIEKLEFDLLELPVPDICIFLHMPYDNAVILKKKRQEKQDEHEKDANYLKKSEECYKEISQKYNFKTIECTENGLTKSIEDINDNIYNYLIKKIKVYK